MPISFSIKDRIGTFTNIGDVEMAQGIAVLEEGLTQMAKSDLTPVFLFDLSQSTENRSVEELQLIAATIHERLPNACMALLVTTDVSFGLSRMFGTFASSLNMEASVFRDRDECMAWCLARTTLPNS